MKAPILAVITVALFMASAVALLVLSDPESSPSTGAIIGLIVTSIPSLLAAAFSERASRDIRNGVVQNKAREGAMQALQETGVTEVVELTARGQTAALSMQALARLLEQNTAVTQTNTDATQQNTNTKDGDT